VKKIDCKICPNVACFIKKNEFHDQLRTLEEKKSQIAYKKGNNIFQAGNPISGIYFVQKGIVEEFFTSINNNLETIRFSNDGQTFGQIGFNMEKYPFGAVAKEDTMVCFFDNKFFYDLCHLNKQITFDLMLFYSTQYNKTAYRLRRNSEMNLREKIAHALYFLSQRFGLNDNGELRDCFSREDIASLACTTSEQVSRQLSDFEKEKMIERRTRKIAILEPGKIKSIIDHYLN
jgi:CRP/FNR family transcriptional regulator, anaerobic regulatory protein